MCMSCVKIRYPDRGRICLETGMYLLNYRCCWSCYKCDTKDPMNIADMPVNIADMPLNVADMSSEETELSEVIKYNHTCPDCGHIVASHEYTFAINEGHQEYEMLCMLCGIGTDVLNIVPGDTKPNADLLRNLTY